MSKTKNIFSSKKLSRIGMTTIFVSAGFAVFFAFVLLILSLAMMISYSLDGNEEVHKAMVGWIIAILISIYLLVANNLTLFITINLLKTDSNRFITLATWIAIVSIIPMVGGIILLSAFFAEQHEQEIVDNNSILKEERIEFVEQGNEHQNTIKSEEELLDETFISFFDKK